MKKRLLVLLALVVVIIPAKAQKPYRLSHPNEISTSYGFSLLNFGVCMLDKANLVYVDPKNGAVTGLLSGGTRGALNIGYSRQLNPCISVGGAFGFNRASVNGLIYNANLILAAANIYTFLGTVKFDWFHTRNEVFSMYSKLGLGMMVVQGVVLQGLLNGAIVLPTFQSSFVCLEVGKAVSGFLELVIGMQGIAQAGIRARF